MIPIPTSSKMGEAKIMKTFKGFSDSETFIQFPDTFFHQLLKQIEDAAELKVTLYLLWRVQHMDGAFHALTEPDFEGKELGLAADEIQSGLKKAVQRGSMLQIKKDAVVYFLLNSPRGRATVEAIQNRGWNPKGRGSVSPVERPNIFKLYEENIGPLTPLIADRLKDAEDTYSAEWVVEAVEEAVLHNARNWKYCEAILKHWKEEGRAEKQGRRDDKKSGEQSLDRKIEQLRKRAQK
jgi:DNA replication protein